MIDNGRSNGYSQIGQRDELAQQTVVNGGRLLPNMTSAVVVDTLRTGVASRQRRGVDMQRRQQ